MTLTLKNLGATEITQFGTTSGVKQDVLGLNVTMNDILAVAILQSRQELSHVITNNILLERTKLFEFARD